ncbi:MAG: hypothetical protein EA393_15495, partial [Bacteroidetes bacterium]
MNFFAVLSFIAFVLFIQAGVWILIKRHQLIMNRLFSLLSFLFAIYAFCYYLVFSANTLEQVYQYDRIA